MYVEVYNARLSHVRIASPFTLKDVSAESC